MESQIKPELFSVPCQYPLKDRVRVPNRTILPFRIFSTETKAAAQKSVLEAVYHSIDLNAEISWTEP